MKKIILREVVRFLITIGSAILGSSALSGCAFVPVI